MMLPHTINSTINSTIDLFIVIQWSFIIFYDGKSGV